jgi:galactose mutarotase-like enzyme
MPSALTISPLEASVNFETGELCSIIKAGKEFMWGGGRPTDHRSGTELNGWQHSAIIMFPLVGPAKKEGKKSYINYGQKRYPMVQHGIARYLPIHSISRLDNKIYIFQRHEDGKLIKTEKGPARWPFSYQLEAKYSINYAIEAQFTVANMSNLPMIHSFGWHPAFNTKEGFEIIHNGKKFTLDDILEAKTLYLEKSSKIEYKDRSKKIVLTHDLGNMMVWSPKDAPLVCLEPVTGLPVKTDKGKIGNYNSREIRPGCCAEYNVKITPYLK